MDNVQSLDERMDQELGPILGGLGGLRIRKKLDNCKLVFDCLRTRKSGEGQQRSFYYFTKAELRRFIADLTAVMDTLEE